MSGEVDGSEQGERDGRVGIRVRALLVLLSGKNPGVGVREMSFSFSFLFLRWSLALVPRLAWSQLTVTSASQVQAILLSQPPE